MYIENINSTVPAGTASAVKTAVHETENAVRVESTEGETQQITESQQVSKQALVKNDARTPDDKQASDKEKIKKSIEKMNAQLQNSEVKFGIHEKTDRVTIKLVDKDTKEVIKEFPPEKTLDMIAKCMELAGVLVDEKL